MRPLGYACDRAREVAEITRMVAASRYDLLIMDVDGVGDADSRLVREIRGITSILPIILVTERPTVETAMAAVNLAVSAYFVKPISLDHLVLHAQRLVAGSQLRRIVTDVRTRSRLWDDAVAKLQNMLQEPLDGDIMELAGPLLTTTFEGVVSSVTDLRRVIDCLMATNRPVPRSEVTAMWHKLDLTRTALHETISVLEETKHAFKSKRLGELRRQLQGLLGILEQD